MRFLASTWSQSGTPIRVPCPLMLIHKCELAVGDVRGHAVGMRAHVWARAGTGGQQQGCPGFRMQSIIIVGCVCQLVLFWLRMVGTRHTPS